MDSWNWKRDHQNVNYTVKYEQEILNRNNSGENSEIINIENEIEQYGIDELIQVSISPKVCCRLFLWFTCSVTGTCAMELLYNKSLFCEMELLIMCKEIIEVIIS